MFSLMVLTHVKQYPKPHIPKLCGALISAGDLEELPMPGSHMRHSYLIGMSYDLSTGIFKSSQVTNVQQSLETTVLF